MGIPVFYMRSSSYGAYDWCPHRYWVEYVLGVPSPSGKKADKGNVVHKALEVLARKKLADQRGEASFADEETGREFRSAEVGVDQALAFGWDYYTKGRASHHAWGKADLADCRALVEVALEHEGGLYSPLRREVVAPEQYFDLEVQGAWAEYDYTLPDGSRPRGRLRVKGTVDLVTRVSGDTLEYIDWKTGRRIDWATEKEKTYASLRDDFQLLLYYWALTRLYPGQFIMVTVFYLQDGGPISLCFGPRDLARLEEKLRARFEEIRGTRVPRLTKTWKCQRLCHYGKTTQPGTDQTVCEHHRGEVLQLGTDGVIKKYGLGAGATAYGEGGGRSAKKEE